MDERYTRAASPFIHSPDRRRRAVDGLDAGIGGASRPSRRVVDFAIDPGGAAAIDAAARPDDPAARAAGTAA